jgi:alpha-N-arabinofuranosidase
VSLVQNPILPGTYPDPSVCRVGDDYYLVTSTFEYFPGLPVFHSNDLAHWEQIGHVIDRDGMLDFDGIASSGGLYAPTIRHHDGLFWVVCTLVDQQDDRRGGNFVVTATNPAGPWSEPVWLGESGIDPSLFFDDDGRVWVHGTRLAADPEWFHQTEVWLRELDVETMRLTGPEHILWTGALKGAVWAEGPHLYKIDGRYYLLAAEAGTEFHHAISVARSESVTGPYEGCKGNPVLTHRHLGRGEPVVGVGHADLVEGPDGSWWAVLLAMRTYGGYHYNLGRETFLVPVVWEDGWPVFAPGQGRVPAAVEVPFADAAAVVGAPQVTPPGAVLPDDIRWTTLRRPANLFASPNDTGWNVALRPQTLADPLTPSFLGLRQQHQSCDLAARVTLAGLGVGEEAGLAIRQSEKDHVTLTATPFDGGAVVRATHVRGGVVSILGEATTASTDTLELRIEARDQDYALVLDDGTARRVVAIADGRTLDTVATGGFLGLWLGLYATSNGAPSTTTVTFEHIEYVPATTSTTR